MKRDRKRTAVVSLGALLCSVSDFRGQIAPKPLSGTITLSGAWALYPMAVKWAEEFKKLHPERPDRRPGRRGGQGHGRRLWRAWPISAWSPARSIRERGQEGRPRFRRDQGRRRGDRSAPGILSWPRSSKRGITRAAARRDLDHAARPRPGGRCSGTSAPRRRSTSSPARTPAAPAETWAAYLGKRQEDLGGVGVYGDPGLADAVRRDPLGIGYNNINFAYDPKTLKPVDGIAIVPIDLDGNGRLEPAESRLRNPRRHHRRDRRGTSIPRRRPATSISSPRASRRSPAGGRVPPLDPDRRPEIRARDGIHPLRSDNRTGSKKACTILE